MSRIRTTQRSWIGTTKARYRPRCKVEKMYKNKIR